MPGAGSGAGPTQGAPGGRGAVARSGETPATWSRVPLKAGEAEVMLLGPSARGAGDAPQLVRGPGSPGSCRLVGFTAVYVETWLGKRGGRWHGASPGSPGLLVPLFSSSLLPPML